MTIAPEELEILSKPKVQDAIVKAIGSLRRMDNFFCDNDLWTVISVYESDNFISAIGLKSWRSNFCLDDPALVRLPRSIDDENPGRGMIQMCPIPPILTPILDPIDNHVVVWWEASWVEFKHGEWITNHMGGSTPRLALLRAMEYQVEVKG